MLAAKSYNLDNIPLNAKEINKTMKLADKIMSEKAIQDWINHYCDVLFWKEELRKDQAFSIDLLPIPDPQLYTHEFLYLITNANNKHSYVSKVVTIVEWNYII